MKRACKLQGILSSLVILLPAGIGFLFRQKLPGESDGWSSMEWTILGLPLCLLMIHWITLFATFRDPGNRTQSPKVFRLIFWIMPCISLFIAVTFYMAATQNGFQMDMMIPLLLGVIFLIIGNYMPKCQRNYTIGVKLPWTFSSEENWNHTHRFTGKVWVAGGSLLLLFSLVILQKDTYLPWIFPMILGMILLPCGYSFLFYQKEKKEGSVTGLEDPSFQKPSEKAVKASVGLGIGVLVVVMLLVFQGKYSISLGERSLLVDALFWEDTEVLYESIDSLEYRTEDKSGRRIFGYGTHLLLMGGFHNEEFGSYTRYTYTSSASCIVLTAGEKVMVINAEKENETEELYQALKGRCGL